MLVRHEVKIVWHTGAETAAVSYSRYEDDELADCQVVDQDIAGELPGRAMAFASRVRPTLFDAGSTLPPLAQHRGDEARGSHIGSPAEHVRALRHYSELAAEARRDAGPEPFPL